MSFFSLLPLQVNHVTPTHTKPLMYRYKCILFWKPLPVAGTTLGCLALEFRSFCCLDKSCVSSCLLRTCSKPLSTRVYTDVQQNLDARAEQEWSRRSNGCCPSIWGQRSFPMYLKSIIQLKRTFQTVDKNGSKFTPKIRPCSAQKDELQLYRAQQMNGHGRPCRKTSLEHSNMMRVSTVKHGNGRLVI